MKEVLDKLGLYAKELQLIFHNVLIVFDAEVWERLYRYFFSGAKGRKFERYVGANMEYLVESALEGYFTFHLSSKSPTVVLPPFAGHTGPPHVASQVLRLTCNEATVTTAPSTAPLPDAFRRGIFSQPGSRFPARQEDLCAALHSGLAGPGPVASQKFEVSLEGLWGAVQASPRAPLRMVLQPFDVTTLFWFHDYLQLPLTRPHLEIIAQTTKLQMRITQSQYQYFFTVFGERIRWDPEGTKAVPSAPGPNPTPSTPVLGANPPPPIISQVMAFLPVVSLTLVEEEESPTAFAATSPLLDGEAMLSPRLPVAQHTGRVISSLELEGVEFLRESLALKTVNKAAVARLTVRDLAGEQAGSPFAVMVAPLPPPKNASGQPSPYMILFRYEAPLVERPSGPSSEVWLHAYNTQVPH